MNFKKILSYILCLSLVVLSVAGCSKNNEKETETTDKKELNILYSNTEYGDEWLKTISSKYKDNDSKLNINLKVDNNISKNASSILERADNVPEIMILPATNWQYWASKNYLENLNSIYDSTISEVKFSDKMNRNIEIYTKYEDNHYYVPLDEKVSGIIYNKKLFEKYNWNLPQTLSDFENLCAEIKKEGIIPISWSIKGIDKWDMVVKNWWTKYEGKSQIDSYLKVENPSAYKQDGIELALNAFQTIVSDDSNSMLDVKDSDDKKAINMFMSGKTAMIIADSSIEVQNKEKMMDNFEMDYMDTPIIQGSNDNSLFALPQGQIMIIPKLAKNKDEAKKFIEYMSNDDNLMLFNTITSTPRPFKYQFNELDGSDTRTVFAVNTDKFLKDKETFYFASNNPAYYNELSDWPKTGSPYLRIYLKDTRPSDVVMSNYYYVLNYFDKTSN